MKKLFKYIILIFTSIIFIVSCSENNEIIEKDKLVIILSDLHKTNAILGDKKLLDVNLKKKKASYYNYFFKKHNITQAQFEKTIDYYSHNLQDYVLLYDEIVLNLKNEELVYIEPSLSPFNLHKIVKDSIARKIADDALWIEIWNKEKKWFIPDDTIISLIADTITVKEMCKLKLFADILIYKDDSCKEHNIVLKAYYNNATVDTLINDTIIIDGKYHNYKLQTITDSIKKIDSIICNLVNYPDSIKHKHLKIKNISIKKYIVNYQKKGKIKNKPIKDKKLKHNKTKFLEKNKKFKKQILKEAKNINFKPKKIKNKITK